MNLLLLLLLLLLEPKFRLKISPTVRHPTEGKNGKWNLSFKFPISPIKIPFLVKKKLFSMKFIPQPTMSFVEYAGPKADPVPAPLYKFPSSA